MQKFYFAYLLFFISLCAFSQNKTLSGTSGSVSGGMSGISTALADEWAVFNNIGALSATKDLSLNAMMAFENRFNVKALNSYHFGVINPFSFGGVGGLTINRFGDKYYNETQVGLGYSHQVSLVSVGAKVNYYQVAVNDQIGLTQSTRSTLLVELGGLAKLSEKWAVGIYGYNFTQSKLKAAEGEDRIPVILKAGVSYKPYKKLFLSLETEKDIDYDATVRAGINYQIHQNFFVRTGISTKPFNSSFGIGFQPKNLSFDYALSNNNALGWIHQLSLRYVFKKKVVTVD
ncbi:hypothetical protein AD998_18555 [bacterium 336/3]|nr:hypothetical protein AD998_18555 [bacterium 336/3]